MLPSAMATIFAELILCARQFATPSCLVWGRQISTAQRHKHRNNHTDTDTITIPGLALTKPCRTPWSSVGPLPHRWTVSRWVLCGCKTARGRQRALGSRRKLSRFVMRWERKGEEACAGRCFFRALSKGEDFCDFCCYLVVPEYCGLT